MKFSKNTGKKKGVAAAVICFVAAIAITGAYTFNDYKESKSEKEIAKAEEMNLAEDENVLDEAVDSENISNEPVEIQTEETDTESDETEQIPEETEEEIEKASSSQMESVNFAEDSLMLWPVSGVVLMDYSMDQTVYYKTLDQYKYNPAMIIAGAQGDQVIAGASGIVKSIDNVAETGTTVNVDFGNGYEAFYGQLVSVQVKTGDYVDATTTLGYVAEPTKYYVSEGSNLYFEMRKDGQPVDPKMYLTE